MSKFNASRNALYTVELCGPTSRSCWRGKNRSAALIKAQPGSTAAMASAIMDINASPVSREDARR
jgi:hypothetical protein